MARKRFNKKFALTVAGVVGGVAVLGGGAFYFLRPKDSPARLEAMAQIAIDAKDYDAAYTAYGRSVTLLPTPEKFVRLGDIARVVAAQNPDKPQLINRTISAYNSALEIDPRYIPALTKLIDFQQDRIRAGATTPTDFARLRELAERLVAADATNNSAKFIIPMSHIQESRSPGFTGDEAVVDKAVEDLRALVAEDASDANAVDFLVKAQIQRGGKTLSDQVKSVEARKAGALATFAEAAATLDAALAKQDNNLPLHMKGAELYAIISNVFGTNFAAPVMGPLDAAQRDANLAKMRATLERGRAMALPDKPFFVEINMMAANEALQSRGREAADAIYRSAMEQAPNSQTLRIGYADFLSKDATTRSKAIEILSLPVDSNQGDTSFFASNRLAQLTAITQRNLNSYRLDQAASLNAAADKPARDALLKSVEEDTARLLGDSPDDFRVLTLQGRLLVLQGRNVDAIQKYERARTSLERVMGQQTSNDQAQILARDRLDVMLRLSDAYRLAGQFGKQRDLLREVINAQPRYIPARAQLVELLVREGSIDAAKAEFTQSTRELDAMEKEIDRPDAKAQFDQWRRLLEIASTQLNPDRSAVEAANLEAYGKLPESTREQRIRKGTIAAQLKRYAEAAAILQVDVAADPKDVEAATLLIQVLALDGKTDQAKEVVKSALAANPNDNRLKMLDLRLSGGTNEDARKLVLEQIKAIPDEFTRELQLYAYYSQTGDRKTALENLARAETLKPNDRAVLDLRFQNALVDKDWATAERILPNLVSINGDQAGGRLYRFKLYAAKGQGPEALRVATELSEALPGFALSWVTLGQAHAMANDHERALVNFQQALQIKPDEKAALVGAINSNYALNRPTEARKFISDGLTRLPADADIKNLELNHELRFGDPEKSAKYFEDQAQKLGDAERDLVLKVNSLKPGPEQDALRQQLAAIAREYGQVLSQGGRSYAQLASTRNNKGDLDGARDALAKALSMLTEAAERRPDDLQVMAGLAQIARFTANPASVESLLKRTADLPAVATRPEPMLILADYYLSIGRPDDADKSIREAVRRGGTAVEPRSAAANVLFRLGKVDDALAVLADAEGAATNKAIQRQRADILLNAGRFEQAEKSIRAQLQVNPNDSQLSNLLISALLSSNRFDDADKEISTVLTRDPQNPDALYFRSFIQVRKPGGDLNAAIRDLRALRDSGQLNGVEQRMMLVDALFKNNEQNNAIVELRNLLQATPSNRQVRLRLADALAVVAPPRFDEALAVINEGLARPDLKNSPDLLMSKTRLQLATRNPEAAVATAREAVKASNSAPLAIRAYLDTLLTAKQGTQVLRETEEMNKAGLKAWWLFASRAAARAQLNDTAGAINEYSSALQSATDANDDEGGVRIPRMMAETLGPDNAIKALMPRADENLNFRLMASQLQASTNRLPDALATLEPALAKLDSLKPDEQARIIRGAASLLVAPGPQQNYDRAAELYRKLVKLTPDDLATLNNLAFIVAEKVTSPNPAEALQYSERAVDIVRRSGIVEPLVYDTHGWNLVLNNRIPEGIDLLTQALDRRSFMEAHYHLGMAYLKFNLPREALDQLQRAENASNQPGTDPSYKPRINEGLNQAALAVEKLGATGGARP